MKAIALAALAACGLCGQDRALDRVADAADRLRYVPENDPAAAKPLVARFERYLREWIETQLPKEPDAAALLSSLKLQLDQAGLLSPNGGRPDYGYVGTLDVTRPMANVDALLVIAGVMVPCGTQDSALLYEWTESGPVRTLESHGSQIIEGVHFSPPDNRGDRLVLIMGRPPACGAHARSLAYSVYRLPAGVGAARLLHSGTHAAARDDYRADVRPNQVRIELEDRTIDPALTRTHVLRFRVDDAQATRIDPVALDPRDFVDEWLTQPWSEMEKRSAPAVDSWHSSLHRPGLIGRFRHAHACPQRPNHWEIAVELEKPHPAKDEDPTRTVYFLVREYGRSRFEMVDVSDTGQSGCSAE
jgi:hypothetical protein